MSSIQSPQGEDLEQRRRIAALERELEEMTQERDELRQIIFETPAVFGVAKGKDYILTLVNRSWEEFTQKSNVIGKSYRDVFPEHQGSGTYEMLDHILETGEPFVAAKIPADFDRGAGKLERRWMSLRNFALRGRDGKPTGGVCYADDITPETVAAEETEALTAKLQTFFMLAENAPDGILVTVDGKIRYANPAFGRMVDHAECLGKPHSELLA